MRFRPRDLAFVGVALSWSLSCASRPEGSFPTLEDYSDGVSVYAQQFLASWQAGTPDERFYARDFAWSGPLPGDSLLPALAKASPLD